MQWPDYMPPTNPRSKGGVKDILEINKKIRLEGVAKKDDTLQPTLRFPPLHYQVIIRRFPELVCPDAEIREQAWAKFMASSLAEPYMVRDRFVVAEWARV